MLSIFANVGNVGNVQRSWKIMNFSSDKIVNLTQKSGMEKVVILPWTRFVNN